MINKWGVNSFINLVSDIASVVESFDIYFDIDMSVKFILKYKGMPIRSNIYDGFDLSIVSRDKMNFGIMREAMRIRRLNHLFVELDNFRNMEGFVQLLSMEMGKFKDILSLDIEFLIGNSKLPTDTIILSDMNQRIMSEFSDDICVIWISPTGQNYTVIRYKYKYPDSIIKRNRYIV